MPERSPPAGLQTEPRPVGAGRSLAEERSVRSRLWLAAKVPPLGALLGGASVGLLEALYINFQSYGSYDWSGLVYAVLLYGAVGLGMGLALSALAVAITLVGGLPPDPPRSWTLSFLAVSGSMAFFIGRFILRRDLFAEAEPTTAATLGLIAVVGITGAFFYLFVRNALAKTFFSFMTHALGTGIVYSAILLLTLAIGAGSCLSNRAGSVVPSRPIAAELEDRPNFLLIVVDTLRADALGAYGASGNPSPHFDGFAAESVLYQQAIAQSPWTRPSFASLLTSTVSCTHQTFRKADQLPEHLDTIGERLQLHGYTTGAIVNNINIASSFNFHQGFDTFEFLRPAYAFRASQASFRLTVYQGLRRVWERYLSRHKRVESYYWDAERITDETVDWLTLHGQDRFFLMVQYMDPHDPYFPHPYDGTGYARVEHPSPEDWEAASLQELYAGEVRFWDEHFGRLLAYLEREGLAENTVIVVTSDHGEEFGEHGGFWHGNRLYDEAIRVPLVLRPAGGGPPRESRDVVRLIDVAPTLVELAGSEPGKDWQGFSLLREYALRQPKHRLALAEADFEGFELHAVRDRDWKLVTNRRNPPGSARPDEELFYLRDDPGEGNDLAGDPGAAWAMERRRSELAALRAAGCGRAVERVERASPPDPSECEMLRSLGYIDIAESLCRGVR